MFVEIFDIIVLAFGLYILAAASILTLITIGGIKFFEKIKRNRERIKHEIIHNREIQEI